MSAVTQTEVNAVDRQDDSELPEFVRLKRTVREGWNARSPWRKEAKRAFDYVAGNQWSEEDKALLASQNRPAVTFNRTAPIIKAVCGLEVNNRNSVIYLPRTLDDTGGNEVLTAAGKWVRDECGAEDEESEAFRDNAICGEGWTEHRMDYDDDPQGQVVIERIDPLEMGVNKTAVKANYTDARVVFRVRDMDPDDVRALLDLPQDLEPDAMHVRWLDGEITPEDGGMGNKKDYPDKTRDGIGSHRRTRGVVRIVQCQYWERQTVNLVSVDSEAEQGGSLEQLNDEEFAKFQERAAQAQAAGAPISFQHARSRQKVYYECFLFDGAMYGKRKLEMGMFQFQAMTGERDRSMKCFYGMVRDMFDPQMWANKWLSQTMHIMNTNAKGGLLAETDAFVNQRKAENDWADNTKIVWVKPGSLQKQKIKDRTPPPLPQGLGDLMGFAISSIRDVTGVNLELLGQADREQAASLESQRRQSAMTILASLFDSLRKYRKRSGKLTLFFIHILPDGILIRIIDKGQIKYVPLVKSKDYSKFDTIIDEAPTSPDQKQFVWAVTAQVLQMGILPPQAVVELLKYSPYPESVVLEIRKSLGLDQEQMPPEQLAEKLKQAEGALQVLEQELQNMQAQLGDKSNEEAIKAKEVEIEEYRAETERLRAQWDAAGKGIQAATTVVTTGAQTLPSGEGGANPAPAPNEGELAEIKQMLAALMQHIGNAGQPPAPQPEQSEFPPEAMM